MHSDPVDMVENFGKQFTLAREALGLSLSDASTRIKIREEYLEAIENDDLAFQLPKIYIRGFIRNYAKLLNLDVGYVMQSCPIPEFRVVDSIKYSASALVESVKSEEEEIYAVQNDPKSLRMEAFKHMFHDFREKISNVPRKILITFAGIGTVLLLVLVIIFTFGRKGGEFNFSDIIPIEAEMIPAKSVTLSTTGTVKVVIRNKGTLEKIFSGNLPAGTAKTVSYYKPVQIFYDNGEHLLIQQDNGDKVYPQPGRGGIEIK
jgi:transcriptional regulator with XRE-family HTH domain